MTKPSFVMIILLILVVCILTVYMPQDIVSIISFEAERIEIYCQYSIGGQNNGVYSVVTTDTFNYNMAKNSCRNIDGVSVFIDSTNCAIDSIISSVSAKVVSIDKATNSYYCYSSLLSGGIYVDGNIINMQIAQVDQHIIVGYPIILGSY